MNAAAQVAYECLPPATGGEDGERDRVASRLLRLLSRKTFVIGACVVFTIYIAVGPLGFLLSQSFFTPQQPPRPPSTPSTTTSPPTPAATPTIELENGFRTHHAGGTAVFGDMALIGQRYKPDLALLLIGGNFSMDRTNAGWTVKDLLRPKAVIAEIEVERETGRIRGRKFTVAHDCGLIVNPETLRHTIEGGLVQALSRSLFEEVQFDPTKVNSVDWLSCPILNLPDAPEAIDVVLINRPEVLSTGGGEAICRIVPAAIANAFFDATGVRLRQAPMTPERVLAVLAKA